MKYLKVGCIVALCFAIYLNRAYAHMYSTIGSSSLVRPIMQNPVTLFPDTSSTNHMTYVALGDSLTAGVGASREEHTFAYLLAARLANKKNATVTLVNLGEPGATTADVLNRQVPRAVELHPDVLTLVIGVNDIHNRVPIVEFQNSIRAIVDSLVPVATRIYVTTIPYIGSKQTFLPPYREYIDWQTRRYTTALRVALQNRPVTLIDLYTETHERAWHDASYYALDGFHPSDIGYNFWSTILYDRLDY